MSVKNESRLRRARKTRARLKELGKNRLTVYRTPKHIYAQILNADGSKVLVSASTLEKGQEFKFPGNVEAATKVGLLIAEKAKSAGITEVAFDRSGFQYHGRIKALADGAREAGLEF
jgi:large subunit ribosomal protein L18